MNGSLATVHGLLGTIGPAGIGLDIGRSLREALYMFWDTLWALVLGFGLSGAVQAFVSRERLRRSLGDHRPASVARASLFGMASSSCSYAASAMARSLFSKGADFVTAMVFMFASTNLVVELGIVLLILIGWQFLAAEFVGGVIMIVLLALAGGAFFRGRALERAKAAAGPSEGHDDGEEADRPGLSSLEGWSDAAGYMVSDLTMLRREMVIGFTLAGFLSVLVSNAAWGDLFLKGHGAWTVIENVAVGPLVALLSSVCSVGNVPLAAALWKGGIAFGGVVSFVFADLIALPLLFIYKKQYRGAMAWRMLGVFWPVMSLAGLATGAIFSAAGLVPASHPGTVVGNSFASPVTSGLDALALLVFGGLYLLHRRRPTTGDGRYASDPVCGMQVERRHAPARFEVGGSTFYFCSEHCRDRYAKKGPSEEPRAIDPICHMEVDPKTAAAHRVRDGDDYYFCCVGCAETFDSAGVTP